MANKAYDLYMRSDAWRAKRQIVLARDGWECQLLACVSQGYCDKESLQVHHKHYRNFGNEQLDDLITLCPQCHDLATDLQRRRRYTQNQLPGLTPIAEHSVVKELINYGIDDSDFPDSGYLPDHSAQWTHGKSA